MLDLKNKEREKGGNGWGSDWALRSGKRKRHRRGCNKNRLPRCDKKFTKRPSGSPRQTKRILSTVPESSTLLTSTKPSSPPLSLYVSRERERERESHESEKKKEKRKRNRYKHERQHSNREGEREREREREMLFIIIIIVVVVVVLILISGFRV